MSVIILPMHQEDIIAVAKIHAQQFERQKDSEKWIKCNFAAYPRIMIFVARDEKDKIIGYIQWIQKSGFRQQSVLELEQIAVQKNKQAQGVGTLLIKKSLGHITNYLKGEKSSLKAVLVSTRADNTAKSLYKKILRAEDISVIKDLYSFDEVLMLARDIQV